MVILMSQQRWHRRDAKKASQKKFKSDNRNSIRMLFNIVIDKAMNPIIFSYQNIGERMNADRISI